jgi:hypothetical protein
VAIDTTHPAASTADRRKTEWRRLRQMRVIAGQGFQEGREGGETQGRQSTRQRRWRLLGRWGTCEVTMSADHSVMATFISSASGGGGPPPEGNTGPGPSPTPNPTPHELLHCHKGFKKKTVHGKTKAKKIRGQKAQARVIYGLRKSSPRSWGRRLCLRSAGPLVAVLAILATVLPPTALAQRSVASSTHQIKRCDKKFSGDSRTERKARRRCIKAARKAAKHKGTSDGGLPGRGEPSPGSTLASMPVQGSGASSLALTTTALHEGVAGLPYVDQLSATGGTAPYTYAVTGLPAGLSSDSSGLISGSPNVTGTSNVGVEVTDADGAHVQGVVSLAVSTTMPADCMQQSCSHLTADGETVQIDGSKVTSLTRDPQTEEITGLNLTGPAPAPQQIIVVSPTDALPSGLTALVITAVASGGNETSLTLQAATIGDAYANGVVQAIGPTTPVEGSHLAATTLRSPAASAGFHATPTSPALANASLNCGSGVSSDLRGLSVKPSLTPSMVAIWHHPLFGGGGFYPGTGGLELFQFDLNGNIQLNMGVSISGKATCNLQLPSLVQTIPAGDLGAVVIETMPTLTLKADGKVDTRASITLSCGTEYRWDVGNEYRGSYCAHRYEPLRLAADTGVNVTASGTLETAVSLDDVVGVDGAITAALHAGYTPTLHPVAELDASVDYALGACLVCFWKGSPTRVTIAHGTLYHRTIATYDSAPPPPTDNSIQAEGLEFGALQAGQESVQHLTAGGGAEPYSFAVSPDPNNVANVPSWVNIESDGTVRIEPPPGTEQSVSFYVYTTDATGERSPYERDLVTFSVTAGGGVSGMSWAAIEPPVPAGGLAGTGQLYASSMACSAAICVVGGTYEKSGTVFGMIDTLTSGVWTAIDVPVPSGADPGSGNGFTPVCSSGGTCVATGWYFASGQEHMIIDTLTSGVWTAIDVPVPPGGEPGSGQNSDSPACSSAGTCVLTGRYQDFGGHERRMIDTLDHGTWTAVEVPVPPAAEPGSGYNGEPSPLACSSSGICVVGGQYRDASSHTRSMIDTYAEGTWTAIQTPVPTGGEAGTAGIAFGPPACSSAGTCILTGSSWASGHEHSMVITLVDGTWSAIKVPVPPGGEPGSGVAYLGTCPSAHTCLLTGAYEEFHSRGMIDTLANGVWTATEVPVPPGGRALSGQVGEVACSSATVCAIVGAYQDGVSGSVNIMIDTLAPGTWTAIEVPVPADGIVGSNSYFTNLNLSSLTCSSAGSCVTAGQYRDTSGTERHMIDTLAGGTWSAVQAPVPTEGEVGSGSVYQPACSSSGTCAVVGVYRNSSGETRSMIVAGEPEP